MTRYATAIGLVLLFTGLYLLFNPVGVNTEWVPKNLKTNTFEDWIDFKVPGKFSVKMPFKPQQATESMRDTETGEIRSYEMWVSETPERRVFMVALITFPADSPQEKMQVRARRVVMEMLERKEDNKLEKIEISSLDGFPAIDFTIQGKSLSIDGTALAHGDRVYLLTEIAPLEEGIGQFYYFRDSFKLGDKK